VYTRTDRTDRGARQAERCGIALWHASLGVVEMKACETGDTSARADERYRPAQSEDEPPTRLSLIDLGPTLASRADW
jgi:hypothetical protein